MTAAAALRYLAAADVAEALPPPAELVDLAELALRSLVAGADNPPNAVIADPDGRFAFAMAARLTAAAVPGGGADADLLGTKWIAGSPRNRAAGLPALSALVILSDPASGVPVAIMDGGTVTAARTAALSGVAVRLLGPSVDGSSEVRAVIVGAGAQGRAHAAMLGAVRPGVRLVVHDRHPDRAETLAASARSLPGIAGAEAAGDPHPALRAADVVISATALDASRPVLGPGDVGADALIIPVDYGAYVTAELVRAATTVAVDDRDRYERSRSLGRLAGWPDATVTLGRLLLERRPRPAGVAVALHQGPGVADLVVAEAVRRRAEAAGLGIALSR